MGKHYCDYCDRFLTHDSFQGRKQHNRGKKHQENVRAYFAQYLMHGPPPMGGMPPMDRPHGAPVGPYGAGM